MDQLAWIFAAVCGQNLGHTWAPGGVQLPCCERCTGLYAGALFATLLLLGWRPRFSGRFLMVHGLFLLLMVPFGYHWIPHGAVLRTVTGFVFGAGLTTFLMVSLARRRPRRNAPASYFIGMAIAGGSTLALALSAWRPAGHLLTALVTAGLVVLFGLITANVVMYGVALGRRVRRRPRERTELPDAGVNYLTGDFP